MGKKSRTKKTTDSTYGGLSSQLHHSSEVNQRASQKLDEAMALFKENKFDLCRELLLKLQPFLAQCEIRTIMSVHTLLGDCYYALHDNEEAFKAWLLAARLGEQTAMINVADTYQNGDTFLEADRQQAIHWFKLAAKADSPPKPGELEVGMALAQHRLARIYDVDGHYQQAAALYRRAVETNRSEGLPGTTGSSYYNLGLMVYYGRIEFHANGRANMDKAASYFQKAARCGTAAAYLQLYLCYVDQQPELAFAYLIKFIEEAPEITDAAIQDKLFYVKKCLDYYLGQQTVTPQGKKRLAQLKKWLDPKLRDDQYVGTVRTCFELMWAAIDAQDNKKLVQEIFDITTEHSATQRLEDNLKDIEEYVDRLPRIVCLKDRAEKAFSAIGECIKKVSADIDDASADMQCLLDFLWLLSRLGVDPAEPVIAEALEKLAGAIAMRMSGTTDKQKVKILYFYACLGLSTENFIKQVMPILSLFTASERAEHLKSSLTCSDRCLLMYSLTLMGYAYDGEREASLFRHRKEVLTLFDNLCQQLVLDITAEFSIKVVSDLNGVSSKDPQALFFCRDQKQWRYQFYRDGDYVGGQLADDRYSAALNGDQTMALKTKVTLLAQCGILPACLGATVNQRDHNQLFLSLAIWRRAYQKKTGLLGQIVDALPQVVPKPHISQLQSKVYEQIRRHFPHAREEDVVNGLPVDIMIDDVRVQVHGPTHFQSTASTGLTLSPKDRLHDAVLGGEIVTVAYHDIPDFADNAGWDAYLKRILPEALADEIALDSEHSQRPSHLPF